MTAIEGTHPFYLFSGILMMVIYISCQAVNFSMILKKLGHPASFLYCLEYVFVGTYFGGITPGASGAQPSQLYYMNKDKIHVDISAITVFFMVFESQLVILGLGGLFAFLRSDMVNGFKPWMKYLLLAGVIVLLGLTFVLLALMFLRKMVPFVFRIILKAGEKARLIKEPELMKSRFEAITLSYREKSKVLLRHPDLFVKVFAVTILQWISYYMVSYLVYLSFGYHEHSAIDLMAGQSLISIAVSAVPIPGSVGVAENSYLNVFGQFYQAQELPSAMILSRFINFYLPLFASFVVYLIVHFRVVKQKKLLKEQKLKK
jgi:uncharacterized protein (TIRG00374 family)